jgi:O-antigen/teichoic acid export membrane protein
VKESLSAKTLKNLFYMSLGTGSQFILQFILLIVLSRLLSPKEFGIINAGLVIISFISIISLLGVGPAIIQREKLTESHIKTGFALSLWLNILLAVVVFLSSFSISRFFGIEELGIILRWMTIIFIFQGTSTVAESLMARNLNIKLLAKVQFLTYFLYGLTGIILALKGYGVWSLVIANIVQFGTKSLILIIVQPHKKGITFNINAAKDLIYFGGGVSIAKIFNHIALQGDNFVVGKFIGPVGLGLYSRAYQLMTVPVSLFGKVLDMVLFPSLSKVQNDNKKLTKVYKQGISLISLVALPFSVILIFYSTEIVSILFGTKWIDIVQPFSILAAGILFRASYKISDALIQAKGAIYQRAIRQIIYAAIILLGTWLGHFWGIVGVALGVLFALFVNYIMMAQLSIRLLNMKWQDFIKPQLPGIILGALTLSFTGLINVIDINYFSSEIIEMVLTILTVSILLLILVFIFPKVILGKEGIWFVNLLLKKLNIEYRI